MQCRFCGENLGGATIVCPHCGASLIEDPKPAARRKGSRRRIWLGVLLTLLAIVVFVGAIAGASYAGLYYGERDRQERRASRIQDHYQAGLVALNDGRYERAVAEFGYVLEIDPNDGLAKQGLAEARSRLEVKPTPTLEVARNLAQELLDEAQAAFDRQDWVATARTLTQLRALDASYDQQAVEDMLFQSLYNAGQQYLEEDQLEVGISYLDQAIALRPLEADVVDQRNLAARYLDALNYWGVDWGLCIKRLEALYTSAPDYKDVAQRLYRAYLSYGDLFSQQGEMCPAETWYTQALRMYADSKVEQERATAAQVCLAATPVPISGTSPILTPQPIAGFTVGRLAYAVYNSSSDVYDLYALYADGRIIRIAPGADQPSWEWGTGRLAYRDRVSGAILMSLPEEGVPLQLLAPGQQAWPTLSPDSQRLAYAAPAADGTWTIYVANTNGTGEPRQLGQGWAPAWGRSGLLAYTGCDAEGKCGIVLDNPDDDQPGGRLTGSENDGAVTWAPGGNMLAYMGNVAGNWDLFLLGTQGGVEQLTSDPSDEGLPAWSPDGGSIAYVSNKDGSWAIYVMRLDTRESKRIVDLGASLPGWENERLSWSP